MFHAFLPNEEIMEATFLKVKNYVITKDCPKLVSLYEYFYDNWIHGCHFTFGDWTQYLISYHTNNICENYHSMFYVKHYSSNL